MNHDQVFKCFFSSKKVVILYIFFLMLLSSCGSMQKSPHNRVLIGSVIGGAIGTAAGLYTPLVGLYMVTGLGVGGSLMAIHELSKNYCHLQLECYPKFSEDAFLSRELIDTGEGFLSEIPELKGKVQWKLYQSKSWLKNKQNQFLYVDKIIEFEKKD